MGVYKGFHKKKDTTWILSNNFEFPGFINREFAEYRAEIPTVLALPTPTENETTAVIDALSPEDTKALAAQVTATDTDIDLTALFAAEEAPRISERPDEAPRISERPDEAPRISERSDEAPAARDCLENNIAEEYTKKLYPHQAFVLDYLGMDTPYRGLLVYHGLGSGKTRTAIETALPYIKRGFRIVLLTPGALKNNFMRELSGWATQQGNSDFNNVDLRDPDEQRRLGVYLITYNHLTVRTKLAELKLTNTESQKTIIIIDEVHDLVSQMTKKDTPHAKNAKFLYETLRDAKNSKIIALTGTPIVNTPFELALLFNILRGPMCPVDSDSTKSTCQATFLFPEDEDEFNELFIHVDRDDFRKDDITDNGKKAFAMRILGLVSYYRGVAGEKVYPEVYEHKIEDVYLPQDVFLEYYVPVREKEIEQEIKAKQRRRLKKFSAQEHRIDPKGQLEGDTFRVRSRLVSNFAIPEHDKEFGNLERPNKAAIGDKISINVLKDTYGITDIKSAEKSPQDTNEAEAEAIDNAGEYDELAAIEEDPTETIEDSTEKPPAVRGTTGSFKPVEGTTTKFQGLEPEDDTSSTIITVSKKLKDQIYRRQLINILDTLSLDPKNADKKGPNIFSPENLKKYSPKYYKTLQILGVLPETEEEFKEFETDSTKRFYQKRVNVTPDESIDKSFGGLAFIYSNFRTLEGLAFLSKALEYYGFKQAKINASSVIDDTDLGPGVPRYAIISGDEDTTIRTRIIDCIFNHPKNRYGQYLKVIMGTSASAKGINLKNLRQNIHIEPHWNEVIPDQVKGRGRRILSHRLLEPEEQNLHIYRLLLGLDEGQRKYLKEEKKWDLEARESTDEYIHRIAVRKKIINDKFDALLKNSAVDCTLNYIHNTYEEAPGSRRDPTKFGAGEAPGSRRDAPALRCIRFTGKLPQPPQYTYEPSMRSSQYQVTKEEQFSLKRYKDDKIAPSSGLKDLNHKQHDLYKLLYDDTGRSLYFEEHPRASHRIELLQGPSKGTTYSNAIILYNENQIPTKWKIIGDKFTKPIPYDSAKALD